MAAPILPLSPEILAFNSLPLDHLNDSTQRLRNGSRHMGPRPQKAAEVMQQDSN